MYKQAMYSGRAAGSSTIVGSCGLRSSRSALSAVMATACVLVPSSIIHGHDECGTEVTPAQVEIERAALGRQVAGAAVAAGAAPSSNLPWFIPLKLHVVQYTSRRCNMGVSVGTTCTTDADCPAGACTEAGGLTATDMQTFLSDADVALAQADAAVVQYGDIDFITSDDFAELLKVCHDGANQWNRCSDDGDCQDGTCEPEKQCHGGSDEGNRCWVDGDCTGGSCIEEPKALKTQNVADNVINVYFVPVFPGLCGVSSFSGNTYQGVLMKNECSLPPVSRTTGAHEILHYFDLYHTHETALFGVECPNGFACDVTGDLVCDTTADPGLGGHVSDTPDCIWDRQTCARGIARGKSCAYTCRGGTDSGEACTSDADCPGGACRSECYWCRNLCDGGTNHGMNCLTDLDCDGGTCVQVCEDDCTAEATGPGFPCSGTYDPDPTNIMSYSEKLCRDSLTSGQIDRFHDKWQNRREELFTHTLYVDGTAAASGDGTPMDPLDQVGDAVSVAVKNDYVFIRAGTYNESVTITEAIEIRKWNQTADQVVIIGQ